MEDLSRQSGSKTPVLLGVFAHPDDESFGPGGTLAKYAAEGIDVHVIIATDGDAGSVEENTIPENGMTLAEIRAIELANAAKELGVTVSSLPYGDSGMRGTPENDRPEALIQQPIEQLVRDLREYMERLQPQVVITHDPFGGYGHPDHVRCCEAVSAAFYALRSAPSQRETAPQKLYYTSFDKKLLKLIVRFMSIVGKDPSAVGRNQDIDLREISRWETPVHAVVDVGQYLPQKDAASRAHVSQYSGGPAFLRYLPSFIGRRLLAKESFTRAYPMPESVKETDLFDGVVF